MRYFKLKNLHPTSFPQFVDGFFRLEDISLIFIRDQRCIKCDQAFKENVTPNSIIDHVFSRHSMTFQVLHFWYSKDVHPMNQPPEINHVHKPPYFQFNEELEISQYAVLDKIRELIKSKRINLSIDNLDCTVCGSRCGKKKSNDSHNSLIICDGLNGKCPVVVHQNCYDVRYLPTDTWLCDKCDSSSKTSTICCQLCPNPGLAFKKTTDDKFVHALCGLMIGGVEYDESTNLLNLNKIPSRNLKAKCMICLKMNEVNESKIGACVKCNNLKCSKYYHATCAQQVGLISESKKVKLLVYCGIKHKPTYRRTLINLAPYTPKRIESIQIFKEKLKSSHQISKKTSQESYEKQNSKESRAFDQTNQDQSSKTSPSMLSYSSSNLSDESKMNQYNPRTRLVRFDLNQKPTKIAFYQSINQSVHHQTSDKSKQLGNILPFFSIDSSSDNASSDETEVPDENYLSNDSSTSSNENDDNQMENSTKLSNDNSMVIKNELINNTNHDTKLSNDNCMLIESESINDTRLSNCDQMETQNSDEIILITDYSRGGLDDDEQQSVGDKIHSGEYLTNEDLIIKF